MYGGTKAELERLIKDAASYTDIQKEMGITVDASSMSFDNIVNAIAVVQGHLGIAGATAAEAATTIEGSVNSMKAAWSNLVTGIANENADFEGLIDQFVESVGTVGENVLPRVEQALLGVGKLVEKSIPIIMNRIPEIVNNFIPKIMQSGFNILKSLVKGIKTNAKTIVNAAKDLILNFIDGMVDMLPDVIDAGVELLIGIVEAIPEIAENILKNMPKIIEAIVVGLGRGAFKVLAAVISLFTPFETEIEKEAKNIETFLSELGSFSDVLNEYANASSDLTKSLSQNGKTIADIDDEIKKTEDNITEILKKSFGKQESLRVEDLKRIEEYNRKIRELNEEKLSIYQDEQIANLRRAQLEILGMTPKEAAKSLGKAEAALNASNDAVDEIYNARITMIENQYKAMNTIGSEAYEKDLKEAQEWANSQFEINKSYYNQTLKLVESSSDEWVEADTKKWKNLLSSKYLVKQMVAQDKELIHMDDFVIEEIKKMNLEATSAFLRLQASLAASGQEIEEANSKTISTILENFKRLPKSVEKEGKEILLYLIEGMEENIPSLKNATNLTTKEILDILDANLVKNKSTIKIGKDLIDGLSWGIELNAINLQKKMTGIANSVVNAAKKALGIRSPSRIFKNEVGKQIIAGLAEGIEDYAYLAENAMDDVSGDLVNGFDDGYISEYTVSTSNSGDSSNQNDKTEVNVVVSVDDNANLMGFARALLPLLKVAEKEVYA